MTVAKSTPPVGPKDGADINRFNALQHGVLSRYMVLPWEDADEYRDLLNALVSEHGPQGPTEEHLVEELAGILWRKRRIGPRKARASRRINRFPRTRGDRPMWLFWLPFQTWVPQQSRG